MKKMIMFALASLMAFSMVACSKADTPADTNTPANSVAEKVDADPLKEAKATTMSYVVAEEGHILGYTESTVVYDIEKNGPYQIHLLNRDDPDNKVGGMFCSKTDLAAEPELMAKFTKITGIEDVETAQKCLDYVFGVVADENSELHSLITWME